MDGFKKYPVAVGLGVLSAIFFSASLLLAPASLNFVAELCRHATVALLAGAVTALIFEWRGVYDPSLLAQKTAQSTANQIISEITSIHRNYVPREVFENESLSRRYSSFLNRHVISSDIYRYRGDVAGTTSYQISQIWLADAGFRTKERRFELLLLHPESKAAFEQRIEFERELDGHSLKTLPEPEKDRKAQALVDEVYVTLHILREAANRGEGTDIVVAFYKDVPFYRCEIVQNGLSITYYTKGMYSGTFFHASDSFVYTAFLRAFQVSFRKSDLFSLNGLSEDALLERLRTLGYDGDLLDLGRRSKERIERIKQRHDVLSCLGPM
jgi:hypothetical protein